MISGLTSELAGSGFIPGLWASDDDFSSQPFSPGGRVYPYKHPSVQSSGSHLHVLSVCSLIARDLGGGRGAGRWSLEAPFSTVTATVGLPLLLALDRHP